MENNAKKYIDSEHLVYFSTEDKCFYATFGNGEPVPDSFVWRYLSLSEDEVGIENFLMQRPTFNALEISPEKKKETLYNRIANVFRFAVVVYWLIAFYLCSDVLHLPLGVNLAVVLIGTLGCIFGWNRFSTKAKSLMEWEPPQPQNRHEERTFS